MAELDVGILAGQIILGVIIIGIILSGLRIIRPTHRAAIETLGKYTRFQRSGLDFKDPESPLLFHFFKNCTL
jgi:regulator of protease activity HflC (stomatin/prohibitin superfamily)